MITGPMTARGVIRGRTIELDREPQLPEGQEVRVTMEACISPGPESNALHRAFGGWSEDAPELDAFIEQVRRDRDDHRPGLQP